MEPFKFHRRVQETHRKLQRERAGEVEPEEDGHDFNWPAGAIETILTGVAATCVIVPLTNRQPAVDARTMNCSNAATWNYALRVTMLIAHLPTVLY